MRIAYAQVEPRLGELEANREMLKKTLARTASADLVVLPELASSGYHFEDEAQAAATAETSDGETTAMLEEACRQHDLHVVCGINEREGERRYNSAVVVGPQGLVGVYRKMHLFAREKLFFTPGNLGFPTFRIGDARVGVLICFDWAFPECWTSLLFAGADVVAHPSNLVLPEKGQRAVPVLAMMHRFYAVTANRVGSERELRFTGESLIADPNGAVLASAPAASEHVATVEIDLELARNKRLTSSNHLLDDRRPEVFTALAEAAARRKD